MRRIDEKLTKLKHLLKNMQKVIIAYSGGVDSTLLLKVAKDTLCDNVIAVTAKSETYPYYELTQAKEMTKRLGVNHIVVETNELNNKEFTANPINRCYWCKKELFNKLRGIANQNNINYILDATNYDDVKDFRPGMIAAAEYNIISPLKEVKLTKYEIRELSKKLNLPTFNKPQLACLATRIPYGEEITKEKLIRINKAEEFLQKFNFKQIRVRVHNNIVRIEVNNDDIPKIIKIKEKIITKFKKLGYNYITVDLQGYRSGSMNEVIPNK